MEFIFKVLLNPGPRIHYIWSPTDPAFIISGLPGPCIHYIWSPTDPAFTISLLPQYTQHGYEIILVNINC
ncbi:unnamed protein product [Staurois parvus]|uniref:Uncharacterized protein n=1 Tax=Staurois parvus TaxID=386267 RepID=A0ABN9D599_9NEOB|nr:unnamed protein product [Staurois parvus]